MATTWSWTPGCAFDDAGMSDPSRTWNRTFWGAEVIFARTALAAPGRTDLIVACDANVFPTAMTATHVRAAMRAMRFAHPSIASTLVWSSDCSEGRFQYKAPTSEEEVGRWLDAVVIHRDDLACPGAGEVADAIDVLSSELSHAHALRTKDLLKLYHLTPSEAAPGVHGFLMYLNHTLFDGVGGWQALDCFLHELGIILSRCSNGEPAEAAFDWGKEHTRLARPVSDRVSNKPWSPADLHADWSIIKRMNKVISHPSTNFGLPLNSNTPAGASTCIVRSFKPATTEDLIRAARRHACKLYSLQWATVLIACLRMNPPDSGVDVSVSFPFCPVNLRPRISTLGSAELVSALGFTAIEALDLGRFRAAAVERKDEELLEAVWTLAREIQVQLTESEPWQDDAVRSTPMALKTLGAFFAKPQYPPTHRTIAVTGFGVIDGLLKTSYPVSDSQALTVTHAIFHNVAFGYPEPILHSYSWQGTLYYSFGFSEAFVEKIGGAKEDGPTLVNYIDEIERITYLLAGNDN